MRAALLLRDALASLGLESVPLTTGGDGIHVRVPLARRHGYDEARAAARALGGMLDRVGVSVALDAKMNGHGQQVVAPYSIRPLPTAAVATPLRWDEVGPELDPAFTPAVVRERVLRLGDLAEPLLHGRQTLRGLL